MPTLDHTHAAFRLPAARALALAALLPAAFCLLPSPAHAATFTWDGGGTTDNWSDAVNWNPDVAPASAASTSLLFAGATRLANTQNIATPFLLGALAFDVNAGAFTLNGGRLDFQPSSVPGPALSQASAAAQTINNDIALNNDSTFATTGAGGLTVNGIVSGGGTLTKTGAGTLTLSGANTFAGGFSVGAGRVVALNNGRALAAGNVTIAGGAFVELNNPAAVNPTVFQAGGTGFTGAGTLVKTGAGTVAFGSNGGNVTVALDAGALIDVQAGTLTGSSNSNGIFTNNRAGLNVAAGATFAGVEGTIRVDALTGAGTVTGGFNNAGSTTVGVANGAGTFSGVLADRGGSGGALRLNKEGSGTQTLTGTNTYTGNTTVNGGTLALAGGGNVGVAGGTAVFTVNAPAANAANATLGGTATLQTLNTNVGTTDTGTFTQNGGTHTVSSTLFLGFPGNGSTVTTGVGVYTLNAGALNTFQTLVGNFGTGIFTQTGGTHTTGASVFVGLNGGTGNYNLSGTGQLSNAFNTLVGFTGPGTFTQDAGSHHVGGDLVLGNDAGVTGNYRLAGGTLEANRAFVGFNGTGNFTQLGGTHTVSSVLVVGFSGGNTPATAGTGTYDLSGGILSTLQTQVGNTGADLFTQSGGTHTASNGLFLGLNGGTGIYVLSNLGQLTTAGSEIGSSGTGTFTQNGGRHDPNYVILGRDPGGSGTYNLNGGTLTTTFVTRGNGTGTFNFNGGTLRPTADRTDFLQGLTRANVIGDGAVPGSGAVIDTAGFNVTVAQSLVHSNVINAPAIDGGLTKNGAGTLMLTAASTYTGPTTVNAGTLRVNNGTTGSATGTGPVNVANGATLGGNGRIAGATTVNAGGTLAPGNSPGTLTFDNALTLPAGSLLDLELGGTAAGTYDQVNVGGVLTLGGNLRVTAVGNFTLASNQTFTILDNTGNSALLTTFGNAADGNYTDALGDTFRVDYGVNVDGGAVANDVTLTVLTVVPEPGTIPMLLSLVGAVALSRFLRRHRGGTTWNSLRRG